MKEPDKWCIKVTPENREAIEKWRTANVTLNEYGYCVNKTSFKSTIGYWYPDKPNEYTEISFEEFKVYTSKPLKQAVHCETQEEWDFVLSKLPSNCALSKRSNDFKEFIKNISSGIAINVLDCFWCDIDYWKDNNYQILTFQEWCDLNGYKMEKSKQEILKEFAEKYPPGTKVKSPDGIEFIISTTHKHKGENNDFLQSSPYYTGLRGEVLAVKENSCIGEYLYKDGKYAEIIKDTPKFEVGKWYKLTDGKCKAIGKDIWYAKSPKIVNGLIKCEEYWHKQIYEGGNFGKLGEYTFTEVSIKEIQQYLPDEHPDKIKNDIKFEVGDWVVNLEKSISYSVNEICRVSKISKTHLACENKPQDGGYMKTFNKFRHATPEEINNHLISIGQIPAGEPLNTGIEPNKQNIYQFTTAYSNVNNNWCVRGDSGSSISNISKPKMTLSIDDEELPMVNIIKTNTVKQLLNND